MAISEARSISKVSRTTSFAVLLGLLVSAPLLAQSTAATRAPDLAGVQDQAIALARAGQMIRGAEILVEAAESRAISGAERSELLVLAARLYHHGARADFARGSASRATPLAGRWTRPHPGRAALSGSYRAFESAAGQALEADQPVRAARLLLDAAEVAGERGRMEDVRRLVDEAGRLLTAAGVPAEDVASVLGRVEYGTARLASSSPRGHPIVPAS